MHYSGILVTTRPGEVVECARDLETLAGVEVHFCYPESHRIVAVQETVGVTEQQDGLRRIQALPRVVAAALVEHRIEENEENEEDEA